MNSSEAVAQRKIKERNRRITEILDSAKLVILQKGYKGATMDEIAIHAGITKPTVYQYFRTKEELLVDLLEPLVKSIAADLAAVREKIEKKEYSNGKDIIHDIFGVYYAIFENDPDRFKLLAIFIQSGMVNDLSPDTAANLAKLGRICYREGHKICTLSIEQNFLKALDIRQTTDYVWGSFWGIVQIVQNKWNRKGISHHLKPMIEYSEKIITDSLVVK